MTYLFTPAGMAALHPFVDKTTLFAFDLDGTLAPIVSNPAGIAIPEDIRQALIELDSLAPVAIITGRSRTDALAHLGFSPRYLVGNHGAEGLPGADGTAADFIQLCKGWQEQIQLLLPDMAEQGISLDDKGETIALHYRHAFDRSEARNKILAAVANLTPAPRVVAGIYVKNLAPNAAPHKGTALEALMLHSGASRAIFVGDDVTDEDVFRMKNLAVLGLRVGENQESAARYYLQGQHEMVRLLQEMTALLNEPVSAHKVGQKAI